MGLLRGISRKTYDWQNERSGPLNPLKEKHEPLLATSSATTTAVDTDTNIITVPSGYKATILGYTLYMRDPSSTSVDYQIYIDGTSLVKYTADTTDGNITQTQTYQYDEAPVSRNVVRFTATRSGATNYTYSFTIKYVLEPASAGTFR